MDNVDGRETYTGFEASSCILNFFNLDTAARDLPELNFSELPAFPQIKQVFGRFIEMIETLLMNCDSSQISFNAFNNPEFRKTFYSKLHFIFSEKVEPRILLLKDAIKEGGLTEKEFPEGWEDRIRYAMAWAFLIHYGEKRKGEKEYDPKTGEELDENLDYIRHILRVLFFETRRNVGLIDESTACLGIYHDIKENFDRGIIRILGVPKEGVDVLMRLFFEEIDAHTSPILSRKNIKMSDLIDIVSKKKEEGVLRTRHTLRLFLALCSCLDNPDLFIDYLRSIPVKMADRLDNEKTSRYLLENKPESFIDMMDETFYIFVPFAERLGMIAAFDSILDFCRIIDRKEWQAFFDFRKELLATHDVVSDFNRRIAAEIERRSIGQFQLGRDYVITMRPRSLRTRKSAISRGCKMRYSSASLTVPQIKAMSRGFLNYVIFTPLINDDSRRELLVGIARNVFADMFPELVSIDKYKTDRRTTLGSMFHFATDEKTERPSDAGESKFGTVAYRIFRSPRDLRKNLHGLIHLAIIDDDEEAKKRLIVLFRDAQRYVGHLASQLDFLEKNLSAESVVQYTRRRAESVVENQLHYPLSSSYEIPANVSNTMLKNLIGLVERRVLALFVKPVKIRIRIIQEREDKSIIRDFGYVDIPSGSTPAYALLHTAPQCLLYDIKKCRVRSSIQKRFSECDFAEQVLKAGNILEIYIGETAAAESRQADQIEKAAIGLDEFVLQKIRDEYLGKRKKLSY